MRIENVSFADEPALIEYICEDAMQIREATQRSSDLRVNECAIKLSIGFRHRRG
jgi:hypothetical protein